CASDAGCGAAAAADGRGDTGAGAAGDASHAERAADPGHHAAGGAQQAGRRRKAAQARPRSIHRMRRMPRFPALLTPDRRALLSGALGALIHCAIGGRAIAAPPGFANWVAEFRGRALRRGISAQTYARVMNGLEPDMSVFDEFNSQPELTEVTWQYINRRCSDWRVMTGRERAREYAGLLSRIEKDYGVD